jgi:hypothetical protein
VKRFDSASTTGAVSLPPAEHAVVTAAGEEMVAAPAAEQALVSPRHRLRAALRALQFLRQRAESARLRGRGRSPLAQVEVGALV